MNNQTNPIREDFSNPIRDDLLSAIKKLEGIIDLEQAPKAPSKKKSSLQIAMKRARSFIALAFSEKAREREKEKRLFIQTELLKAIQTIQKNYLYIQKLKKGDTSEQALAESTLKVIQGYNQTVKKRSEKHPTFSSRLSNFILSTDPEIERKMIHLPVDASYEFNYSNHSKTHEKINYTAISFIQQQELSEPPISHQEADAFRAKAISLLQNHGIRMTSVAEEFQTIRSTPVQATIHSEDLKRITITQVLKPFPGEIIAFKGVFQRDQEALHKSVPLQNSFEILTNSYQTGFPHPVQHTGFALADCMIPLYPLRPDLLNYFSPVLKLKQANASELLPNGSLNLKAKEILKLKREVFEENKDLFIQLHLELKYHIFPKTPQNDHLKIIETFFEQIKGAKSVYEHLGQTHETMHKNVALMPFERLKEEFVCQKHPDLLSSSFKRRYLASLEILENAQADHLNLLRQKNDEPLKKATTNFICCMGRLLAPAINQIILQHMSETIGFCPPQLESHEETLQIALYKQLLAFQKELQTPKTDKQQIFKALQSQLQSDIDLFQGKYSDKSLEAAIVKELDQYYHSQFYQ